MTSRGWYVVAALLFLAGGAGAAWVLWSGISGIGESFVRVTVPGSGDVQLDKPGTYTIFHETESAIDGHLTSVPSLDGITITVTDEAGGASIPVKPASINSTYTIDGHSGKSVLSFNAPHPGRYLLKAVYDDGRTAPKTVLAIDLGFFGRLFRTIGLTFALGGIGSLAALAIVLTTFFQRRKMLRAGAAFRSP
jgi:hypothetical protein